MTTIRALWNMLCGLILVGIAVLMISASVVVGSLIGLVSKLLA